MRDKKQVFIAGVKQNCYVRQTVSPINIFHNKVQEKYDSLERVPTYNGYYDELQEKDYPINPQSLYSYADGADYRNDPLQAISSQPKRVNLGDISGVQDFISQDPQRALSIYQGVLEKLKLHNENQKVSVEPDGQGQGNNNGGDK